jgi:hypothetical protein
MAIWAYKHRARLAISGHSVDVRFTKWRGCDSASRPDGCTRDAGCSVNCRANGSLPFNTIPARRVL